MPSNGLILGTKMPPVDLKKRLGAALREARMRLDLTQEELAGLVGFQHAQIVSDIERGGRDIKAVELVRLSRALHVPMSALLQGAIPQVPSVLWRNPPRRSKVTEAKFIERCAAYYFLEKLTGQVQDVSFPQIAVDKETFTHAQAVSHAETMVRHFGLGAQPASSLIRTLEESNGVKILYDDLGRQGSALCTMGEFGPAILINVREPRWRRNFSVAHEVFHLLTWESLPTDLLGRDDNLRGKVEAWANSFASALLLPGDSTQNEVKGRIKGGKVSVSELIDIARQFDVSTDALLWRLANLHWFRPEDVKSVLEDNDVQELDAETRRDDWDRDAPLVPPARFVRLAHLAYARGDIGLARLASLLEVEVADVDGKLREYGLTAEARVIDAELQTATAM